MMNTQIHLVIADDHEIYRDGLKNLLQDSSIFHVVGEAANGRELVALCGKHMPDVVLTDIMMPEMDGIEATTILNDQFPAIRVIALSMFNQDNLVIDMLNAGALGYLLKNANKSEIIDAVNAVYRNHPYYCRSTSISLARAIQHHHTASKWKKKIFFSRKELEIIRLICEEKLSKEIAEELHLSVRTVEEYRLRIKEKMEVKGTTGIVIYAIQNNLFLVPKISRL